MEAWTQFFVRAGIPVNISSKYAKSFEENRITKEMLPDLDKGTLTDLGVTAIGDQIHILRRINAVKGAISSKNESSGELFKTEKPQRTRITAPGEFGASASEARRGKPPPDRNEIYHVKMPSGNTVRTQKILQKAEIMRKQGLAVRGTTGVRQGGRSVSPIDKTSLAARMTKKHADVSASNEGRRHIKITNSKSIKTSQKISKVGGGRIQKSVHSRIVYSQDDSDNDVKQIRVHVGQKKSNHSRSVQETPLYVSQRGFNRKNIHYEQEAEEEEAIELMEEDEEDEDDELAGSRVTVRYLPRKSGVDEYELEEPETSSVHNRISYSSRPSTSYSRQNGNSNNKRASIIDQSDSIFSRVSYTR